MMHTLKLDDMELTALITHLEGQSEIMCESRLNCSNPSETPETIARYHDVEYLDIAEFNYLNWEGN